MEDMGKPMADACWCLVETNTILWSNYPSFKKPNGAKCEQWQS